MAKTVVLQGPIQIRAGYGDHTADIARAILRKYPTWEFYIVPTAWGNCPPTEFIDDSDESRLIRSKFLTAKLDRQPDVFIQITVPNEFQRVAKYNIGITAGIETTIVDASWLEGCNRMDLVIVPSKHSQDVLLNTVFDKLNQEQQKIGELRLTTPTEILFEGVDIDVFNRTTIIAESVNTELENVPEEFMFLFVGHWLQGDITHDRKDVSGLIKTFFETFANIPTKPALMLKTSTGGFSLLDREHLVSKIQTIHAIVSKELKTADLPNIYIMYGDLSRTELNALYNHPKIKAMVSFTKGEGFGRPLLEFTMSKKPLIVSGWSGQLDFVSNQTAVILPGEVKKIHATAVWEHVLLPESSWFYVNYEYAKSKLFDVFSNYGTYDVKARKQYNSTIHEFTLEQMADKMVVIFDKHIPATPESVPLKLPQLPKLRKV